MHASVGPRQDGWLRLAGVFTEFDRDRQRPLRRSAKRASREVTLYSGIQTPKKLKPHWLNPGFHIGFSL
jgi:hypothetical protein